jgi:hypothetical protein
MAKRGSPPTRKSARTKPEEAAEILKALAFGPKQSNEVAAYTLLALLDLQPQGSWKAATNPLRGITPIIEFVREAYAVRYAPNTRETIRDEAVKYFVDAGLVVRNPDDPARPTNSGKTVYQVEPSALRLCQSFGSREWPKLLGAYLTSREHTRHELHRQRSIARIPVTLPSGESIALSPGTGGYTTSSSAARATDCEANSRTVRSVTMRFMAIPWTAAACYRLPSNSLLLDDSFDDQSMSFGSRRPKPKRQQAAAVQITSTTPPSRVKQRCQAI